MEKLSFPASGGTPRGKGIHFLKIECFLHRLDTLSSRFALAGHDKY
jgi:hypothetical protein